MKIINQFALLPLFLVVTGCATTQKPAVVCEDAAASMPANTAPVAMKPQHKELVSNQEPMLKDTKAKQVPPKGLVLADIVKIAKSAAKSPAATKKKYTGEIIRGQAKFVKTPKGNRYAVVADVRVPKIGEVSLWCRNVLGAAPGPKVMEFEGKLTGRIYTVQDFSRDVSLKDCRFYEYRQSVQ